MTYQLYAFGESGHSYKVALALHVAQADWKCEFVDFFNGETRSEGYRTEVNIMGEAPVLKHAGQTLTQSAVILDYLHGKTGTYFGANDDERRDILRWVIWDNQKCSGYLGPLRFLLNFIPEEQRPQGAIDFLGGRAKAALKVLNAHLEDRTWIAADQFSAADLSCCGYLFYTEPFGFDRAAYAHIDAWLTRIESLEHWAHPYDIMQRAYPPAPRSKT